MKSFLTTVFSAAALVSTALLLVGDSQRQCENEPQYVRFDVTGDCGPAGEIQIEAFRDHCYLSVYGAEAVQLPSQGEFLSSMDLLDFDFFLNGEVYFEQEPPMNDSGTGVQGKRVKNPPDAGAPDAGVDAGTDGGTDAGVDAGTDGGIDPEPDGGVTPGPVWLWRDCQPISDGRFQCVTGYGHRICTATLTPVQ